MAITSRVSSTTQMIERSRLWLVQIWQISVSEMLLQDEQNLIRDLRLFSACVRANVFSGRSFMRCRTSRSAVFFPIPGNFEIWFTASSISLEGKSTFSFERVTGFWHRYLPRRLLRGTDAGSQNSPTSRRTYPCSE